MNSSSEVHFSKLGIVGLGTMGAMIAFLFADHGCQVYCYDVSEEKRNGVTRMAKDQDLQKQVIVKTSYEHLCQSLMSDTHPRLLVFSLPHGAPGDKCIDALEPFLEKDDIIIDCSNEHWENTERRQERLEPKGIFYVGCGVSGGYQSARAGPSFSPGGPPGILEVIVPLLQKVAARDPSGRPCAEAIGPRGSGHYIKMVHNGIEQAMMSTLAEVWGILHTCLGFTLDEIADVFDEWGKTEELRDCFLLEVGSDVCRASDADGKHVLEQVRDKVVQDVDESEGTGTWTCEEAIRLHVPAATILSAHAFRCASADLSRRIAISEAAGGTMQAHKTTISTEELRKATLFCFLLSFVQGLSVIRQKDTRMEWQMDYLNILQVWRSGTIIRAGGIMDLLRDAYFNPTMDKDNILSQKGLAKAVSDNYSATKSVVLQTVEKDVVVPAISQSLEFYKYMCSTMLPTRFMEAQLDYFGCHMFDREDDEIGKPVTGKHHFEWKPARGPKEKHG